MFKLILFILLFVCTSPISVLASSVNSVYTVNTVIDSDGTCTSGNCSLREAIKAANSDACPSTIQFNLPVGSVILLNSTLPTVTDANTIIDGTANGLFPGDIIIDGSNINTFDGDCFRFEMANNCAVYGLSIRSCDDEAIQVRSSLSFQLGAANKGNFLYDCGFNAEDGNAVIIRDNSNNAIIKGNYFGVTSIGQKAENGEDGIEIYFSNNAIIGGVSPLDANHVVYCEGSGIYTEETIGVQINGNVIGYNPLLTLDGEVGYRGIEDKNSTSLSIGNQAGNLIREFHNNGIQLSSTSNAIIKSNTIIGSYAFDSNTGISAFGASFVTIGGNSFSEGNSITNTNTGIWLGGQSNFVSIHGNEVSDCNQRGIHILDASSVEIGGEGQLLGNTIHGNTFQGLRIEIGTDIEVSNNEIFENKLGITFDSDAILNDVIIGSNDPTFGNEIYNNTQYGINIASDLGSSQVKLMSNAFYGNATETLRASNQFNLFNQPATISSAINNTIIGESEPNRQVDIYANHPLSTNPFNCMDWEYMGSTFSDGFGNWSYFDEELSSKFTVTSIVQYDNSSSIFSECAQITDCNSFQSLVFLNGADTEQDYYFPEGQQVQLTISVFPTENGMQYEWLKDGQPLNHFLDTYVISNFTMTDVGTYSVRAIYPNSCESEWIAANLFLEDNKPTISSLNVFPFQRPDEIVQALFTMDIPDDSGYRVKTIVNGVEKWYPENGFAISNVSTVIETSYEDEDVLVSYEVHFENSEYDPILTFDGKPIQTQITKRLNQNFHVYYNNSENSTDKIEIPIKYINEMASASIVFNRDRLTSRPLGISPYDDLDKSELNENDFDDTFYLTINQNDPLIINASDVDNLNDLRPGLFEYEINYYGESGDVLETEAGEILIAKYGRLYNSTEAFDRVVVVIGGWGNDMDRNMQDLRNAGGNVNGSEPFSVGNYLASENDVWYIGTVNMDGISENGYLVGRAMEAIQDITNSSDMHIICHSKGGLDSRAFLSESSAIGFNSSESYYEEFIFDDSPIAASLKSITFLNSPLEGATLANTLDDTQAASFLDRKIPAIRDMDPNSDINVTLANETVPGEVLYLNVTGETTANIWITELLSAYTFPGDGVVSWDDSFCPDFKFRNSAVPGNQLDKVNQFFIESDHFSVHQTNKLNYIESCGLLTDSTPLLEDIAEMIRSGNINFTCHNCNLLEDFNDILNGSSENVHIASIDVSGSIVSGAQLFVTKDNEAIPYGYTDELGYVRYFSFIPLQLGDRLLIKANGYSEMEIIIDEEIAETGIIKAPMILEDNNSTKVRYPKIELLEDPILAKNEIDMRVSAENIDGFKIYNGQDSTNTFLQFNTSIEEFSFPLDTGKNVLLVEFQGEDSITLRKDVYYFPEEEIDSKINEINLNTTEEHFGANIYFKGLYLSSVINSTSQEFNIPIGINELIFHQNGYLDKVLFVNDQNTVNLELDERPYYEMDNTINLELAPNELQYKRWMSFLNKGNSSAQLNASRYLENLTDLNIITKSETFFIENELTDNLNLSLGIVLNQKESLELNDHYLLVRNEGNPMKLFPETWTEIDYDSFMQHLSLNNITINESLAILFAERKAPEFLDPGVINYNINTTEIIDLESVFVDPDNIPQDVVFEIVDVGSGFKANLEENNLTLNISNCKVGQTYITLSATHDNLTIERSITINLTDDNNEAQLFDLNANVLDSDCNEINGSIILEIQNGNDPIDVLWNNGSEDLILENLSAGIYSVTVTEESGCYLTESFEVNIDGGPNAEFTEDSNGLEVTFNNLSANGNSYYWNFGDGFTSTSENPIHTFAMDGTYLIRLEVTNACGTDVYEKEITLQGTSLNEIAQAKSYRIFPNPNIGSFYIECPKETKIKEIQVFDLLGRQITVKTKQEKNVIEVDFYDSNGTYLVLVVDTNGNRYQEKIIVHK